MRDKSPSLLKFFTLVQGAERDPGLSECMIHCLPEVFQCDYSNRGTWKKIIQSQRFLRTKDSQGFFANGPITLKILRAAS